MSVGNDNMNDSCPYEWLDAAEKADEADKRYYEESFSDPCGFADAVDEDAIERLTKEEVDRVHEILKKIK